MGKRTNYKYGGSSMSSHPYCPARVLLGGRCPKYCPEWNFYSDCSQLPIIDHPSLEMLPSGDQCFVSRVYSTISPDDKEFKRLKAVCECQGLTVSVIERPWNGMETVSHIRIAKPQGDGDNAMTMR